MKIVTEQQKDQAANSALLGFAKGGSLGLAVFIPSFLLASRQFPALARIPTVQKSFLALVAALGVGATNAELAYEKFIASEWQGPTADALRAKQSEEKAEWVSMSPKEKAVRWALENKYKVVVGSWALSMVGSAAFIFGRNPTQTFSQKLVQCRMVAQGATVATLMGAAGLSRISVADPVEEYNKAERHSWENMLNVEPEKAPALGSVHSSHAHESK